MSVTATMTKTVFFHYAGRLFCGGREGTVVVVGQGSWWFWEDLQWICCEIWVCLEVSKFSLEFLTPGILSLMMVHWDFCCASLARAFLLMVQQVWQGEGLVQLNQRRGYWSIDGLIRSSERDGGNWSWIVRVVIWADRKSKESMVWEFIDN